MEAFLKIVECEAAESLPDMLSSRVLPSFLNTVRKHHITDTSSRSLRLWIVDMLLSGNRLSTTRRYLKSLHRFYKTTFPEASSSDFKEVIAETLALSQPELTDVAENYRKLPRLLKKDTATASVGLLLTLFILFDPGIKVSEIETLTFESVNSVTEQQQAIIETLKNRYPRSKYLFPLQQGKRRSGAIIRTIESALSRTLHEAGFIFNGDPMLMLRSLWYAAALDSGLSPEQIVSAVTPQGTEYVFLNLLPTHEISASQRLEIIRKTADHISDVKARWYVMHLRQQVTPEDVKSSIKAQLPGWLSEIDFFYPIYKEIKRENKKRVIVEKPYLPRLLFFRMKSDKIGKLFSKIGDLAWCYRLSNALGIEYATIPHSEMARFQRRIGEFSKDIEMRILDLTAPVVTGDMVEVTSGIMSGRIGEVRKITVSDDITYFTLRLTGTAAIVWKDFKVPASYTAKT